MPSSPTPEKRRIGPFELEQTLGVGGMGIVYLARYLKTGQYVAVKVLSPDLTADPKVAKRFEREMDILKKLKHPHIVQYYGGSTSGAQRYYAMELVKGGSLESLIKSKGPLAWEQAIEYGLQIAKALEHAHAAGVVHRDLKPANLLLTSKGILKLSDFGIARDTQSTALTAAGKTVGTMAYMAPEQINGKHPISAKTDLYALGCVLFEMLTGRTPFVSETSPEMLFKHLDEEPPSIREFNITVPLWFDRVVQDLLAKDPSDRPYDALAVQVMLDEVREKVATQQSIARQTLAGGAATVKDGDASLTKILGKSRKTKKKSRLTTPWYERTWFLMLCLLTVVGVAVWGFRPKNEGEVFAELAPIMSSDDPDDWYTVEYQIADFLKSYPEGEHAAEVRQWQDRIEMDRAEKQADLRANRGRDPESPAERLYMEARQFEKFGDRLTALQKYEGMQPLFDDDDKARPFLNLARRQARKIKDSIGSENDPVEFVRRQLKEADDLYLAGEKVRARSRWQSIVALYENLAEHEVQVRRARARLLDAEAALHEELFGDTQSEQTSARGAGVRSQDVESALP
jgi:serine/threonine-protein kinase